MTRNALVALASLMLACSIPQAPEVPGASGLALVDVTIVDVETGRLIGGQTVLIEDSRISAVVAAADASVPPGMRIVDGGGRFLIPGLWDMHVHLSDGDVTDLQLFVAHGVTAVRDMGGAWETIQTWRDQIQTGQLVGPRVIAAGPIVEDARWLQAVLSITEGRAYLEGNPRLSVANAEEARGVVDSLALLGVDFIKVRTAPPPDAYLALVEQARARHLSVVGHVPGGEIGLATAIEVGQAGFEHIDGLTGELDGMSSLDRNELIRLMAERGVVFTPTLVTEMRRLYPAEAVSAIVQDSLGLLDPRRRYISEALLAFWQVQEELDRYDSPRDWPPIIARALGYAREMHRAGVPILAGTDFGGRLVYPGSSLHDEMALLVEQLGLSPLEAIQAATINPAEFLRQQDVFGTVAPGKRADLVLLDANPLDDVRNVERIHLVVVGGQLLTSEDLAGLRADALRRPLPKED